MSELNERKLHFETKQLHVGQEQADPVTDARAVPIYASTSYVFHNSQHAADRFALRDAGNIYGRLTNPTEDIFEKRIAALEGGVAALATASGAAAIDLAFRALAKNGDHIVSATTIYGGTFNLLEHTYKDLGIDVTFVDPDDPQNFEDAITDKTKFLYFESLGNPNCNLVDMEAIAEIAHRHKIPVVVDNTFGTPYLIRPFEHGADIVVHSATKFIGGHGIAIGGVIVDSGKFDWKESGKFPHLTEPNPSYHGVSFTDAAGPAAYVTYIRAILLRDQGPTLSPLPDSKYKPLYDKYFPNGAGSIFTFEIKGTQEDAMKFIDHLKIFSLLANVADVKSLVIHPASTTHAQLNEQELEEQGIKPTTIRLSIGTEHIDDLIEDLDEAFKAI